MKECENCKLPTDYNSSDNLCKDCIEADKPPPSSQRRNAATPCLCGEGPVAVNSMLQCVECIRWWHPACVGLNGLTKHGCNSIIDWKCPPCFNLAPEVREKLDGDDTQEDTSACAIKEEVRKGVEKAVPQIIEKIQEQYIKQIENFKVEATEIVGKTWADVAKVEQTKMLAEVTNTTTENALQKTMTFVHTNLAEMQNRANNVIISKVAEEPDENVGDSVYSLLQPVIDIPRSDIVKAVRLGKAENGKTRLILLTLRHLEDSKFLHNYKAGRQVVLPDNRGHIWINADLTKTEREAAFQRRLQQRARRAAGPAAAPATGRGGRHLTTPLSAAADPVAPQQPVQQPQVPEQLPAQPPATSSNL